MASPKTAGSKAGERKRDEARDDSNPKFAGGEWDLADQREPEERFGKSRSDDPKRVAQMVGEDDAPEVSYEPDGDSEGGDLDPETREEEPDNTELVTDEHATSAQPEGAGHGNKPRAHHAKPEKPSTRTKKKSTRPKAKKSRR